MSSRKSDVLNRTWTKLEDEEMEIEEEGESARDITMNLSRSPSSTTSSRTFNYDENDYKNALYSIENLFKKTSQRFIEMIEHEQESILVEEENDERLYLTQSLINLERVKEDSVFGDGVNFNSPTFDAFMSDLFCKQQHDKLMLSEKVKKFTSETDLRNLDSPIEIMTSSPLKKLNLAAVAKQEAFRKQSVQNSTFDKDLPEIKLLNVTHSAHNSFDDANCKNGLLNSSGNSAASSSPSSCEEAPKPVFNTTYTSLNVNDDQFHAEVVQQNMNQVALNAKNSAINTTIEIKKDSNDFNFNETFSLPNAKKDGTIDLGKIETAPEIEPVVLSGPKSAIFVPTASSSSINSNSTTTSSVSTQSNLKPSFIKSAIPRSAIPRKASASAIPTMAQMAVSDSQLPESKSYQNFKAPGVLKNTNVNSRLIGGGVANTLSSLKENSAAKAVGGFNRPSVLSSSEFKAPVSIDVKRSALKTVASSIPSFKSTSSTIGSLKPPTAISSVYKK